jgi:hypothetical protein
MSFFGGEAADIFKNFKIQESKFPAFGERLNMPEPEKGCQGSSFTNYEEGKLILLQFQNFLNLNEERSYLVQKLIQDQMQETQEIREFTEQNAELPTQSIVREHSDAINTHTIDQSNFNSLQEVQS